MDEVASDKQKGWRRFRQLKIEKGTLRRRARKIENITLKHAHRFLIRRWTNVRDVSRHTVGWLALVGLLIGMTFMQLTWFSNAFSALAPASGGTYAEGIIGRLETMNPLFASTPAEISASHLIFSGLLSYDRDNQLRPELASSWSLSQDGKVYDVQLRHDVYWHDGVQFKADDVVFTIKLIQNETTKALQYGNWAGVKVEKVSDFEVKFTLPAVYAPFAQSMAVGILPQHLLLSVKPSDLRENEFGRKPIGTGPFAFHQLQLINPAKDQIIVHLDAAQQYFKGVPGLNHFQLHTYADREDLERALVTSDVNAALGLGADQTNRVLKRGGFEASTSQLSNGMFVLFNNDQPLFKDVQVRQAFLFATDSQKILHAVVNRGVALAGPLPLSFLPGETASQASYDAKLAAAKFDAAGWKLNNGQRQKEGKNLEISIVAPKSGDYKLITDELVSEWARFGVKARVDLVDTDTIASDYLQPRNYDVLVYELAFGADPDVSAYWQSSQANPKGLNLANYRSGLVDDALSSAKSRLDPSLRVAKYKTFYEQWLRDTPGIALYQPYLDYVTSNNSTSLEMDEPVVDAVARYRSIERWSISQTTVMTTP